MCIYYIYICKCILCRCICILCRCICIRRCMFMCICKCKCVYVCVYISVRTCLYMCVYVCIYYVCVCVCLSFCLYVCVCVRTFCLYACCIMIWYRVHSARSTKFAKKDVDLIAYRIYLHLSNCTCYHKYFYLPPYRPSRNRWVWRRCCWAWEICIISGGWILMCRFLFKSLDMETI